MKLGQDDVSQLGWFGAKARIAQLLALPLVRSRR